MNEEEELKAKIAAISDKINQHKQHRQTQASSQPPYSNHPSSWRNNHAWAPYRPGGRQSYPQHRNRTLILNGQTSPPPTPPTEPLLATASSAEATGFVSMRGMNKHIMSKDTYEREAKQKLARKEAGRVEKRQLKNREEQSTLAHHVNTSGSPGSRILEVEGIRFQLQENGSKLVRITDPTSENKETPKRTKIAGVVFLRTKNGNLIRATVATTANRSTKREQCQHFTKNGNCPFGPNCRFEHDPSQVAICKDFLHHGTCSQGDNCDLSHEATYHRVSACTHFLRGNCTNAACRYPHVHVSPAAPVCRPFATLGYCAKGSDCDKRHVIECPEYANKGHCADRENGKCLLPHPDRASTLRKVAQRQARMTAHSDNESDVSSAEEKTNDDKDDQLDDVDSDDVDEEMLFITGDETHELTQQQDFVAF